MKRKEPLYCPTEEKEIMLLQPREELEEVLKTQHTLTKTCLLSPVLEVITELLSLYVVVVDKSLDLLRANNTKTLLTTTSSGITNETATLYSTLYFSF